MVDYAIQYRTDYQGQQKTVESADKGITIAQGGFWPSLRGGYGYSTSAVSVESLFDRRVWSVSLGLDVG